MNRLRNVCELENFQLSFVVKTISEISGVPNWIKLIELVGKVSVINAIVIHSIFNYPNFQITPITQTLNVP